MNKTSILTACTIGAVIGAASYFLHSAPAEQSTAAPVSIDMPQTDFDRDLMYWNRHAAREAVAAYQRAACRTLLDGYMADSAGNCEKPVNCTACVSHKGVAHNAVIHDNAWVRVKAKSPDYEAMMRQDKLVFKMSMARQGEIEAGRKAYDHSIRCSRLTWRADVQCKE